MPRVIMASVWCIGLFKVTTLPVQMWILCIVPKTCSHRIIHWLGRYLSFWVLSCQKRGMWLYILELPCSKKVLNDTKLTLMIKGVTHANLGPIWYHSEPPDVPFPKNQFLGWYFLPLLKQDVSSQKFSMQPLTCFWHNKTQKERL